MPDGSTVGTRKGDTHYVHALEYISDCVTLRGSPVGLARATLVRDGSPVKLTARSENVGLTILPEQRDSIDTVIRLER
jgi:hypothetical protein